MLAETTVREIGHVNLSEALELSALVALHDRERGRRYAVRWLARYLAEAPGVTIDEVVIVVGCLAALGGATHAQALEPLRDVSERATRRGADGA